MDKFDTKVNNLGYFTISVLLYLSIVIGIFVKLTYFNEPPKKFTDTRDAFMDVMIIEREPSPVVKAPEKKEEIVKEPEPIKEEPKPEPPKPDVKPPEPVKEPEMPEPDAPAKEQKPDLQDLFKSIDTKKLKQDNVVKKEQPKEQSRKKPENTTSSAPKKKASDVVNSLTLDKVATTPKSQMTGEYNEYFGRISRILQQKWSAYTADSQAKVEVEIVIDMDGSFSYDIKKLSYDEKFNDKVRDFLRSMTFEKFPPPTQVGRAVKFATNIEDKLQ